MTIAVTSPLDPVASYPLVPASAALPLRSASLRVEAKGGLARMVLEQTFDNPHAEPLAVTYVLPLPADGAVTGFSFRIGDRRVEGTVDRRASARERYEEAIAKGYTAAILDEERTSLFRQELGNIPPGATIVCEIAIDAKLRWLDEGMWEWRFPLAAAPRYLGGGEETPRRQAATFPVAPAVPVRATLAMTIDEGAEPHGAPESPSHAVHTREERGRWVVSFADGGVDLDRDAVVRWRAEAAQVSARLFAETTDLPDAYALVTIAPPVDRSDVRVPRDLIVLLDTSGSMNGPPIEQARRVASALVDGLSDEDSMELISFSILPHRFMKQAVSANAANKKSALAWIAGLSAGGGTEMKSGILEALAPLRADGQRQVVGARRTRRVRVPRFQGLEDAISRA